MMTTSFQSRVEAALNEHESVYDRFTQRIVCVCDKWADSNELAGGAHTHAAHVAAVITGLLRQEFKYLEDGYGGMMVHPDGSSTSVSKASTRVTRYVSDWETRADG